MPQVKDKSGRELMSELSHTITFLSAMGFDTKNMDLTLVTALKRDILNVLTTQIGEPTQEVEDAFK